MTRRGAAMAVSGENRRAASGRSIGRAAPPSSTRTAAGGRLVPVSAPRSGPEPRTSRNGKLPPAAGASAPGASVALRSSHGLTSTSRTQAAWRTSLASARRTAVGASGAPRNTRMSPPVKRPASRSRLALAARTASASASRGAPRSAA